LISEVKDWERNKMWPLSCIGFEKDSPCVPGIGSYNSVTGFVEIFYDDIHVYIFSA
jgi:hypothetical protein